MKRSNVLIGLILFLFLFLNLLSYSQTTFRFTIPDPSTDESPYDAIDLDDGSYILACNQFQSFSVSKAHLVKISKNGKMLRSSELDYQGQNSGLMSILQLNINTFLFAGCSLNGDKNDIWLYETDSLLNEINNKVLSLGTQSLSSVVAMPGNDGNILLNGLLKNQGGIPHAFIYKISPDLDSLRFKMYPDHPVMFQPSILPKTDNSGYYFFLTGYHNTTDNYNEAIVELDTSFSITKINGVPDELTETPNSRWLDKKNFILTGRREYDSSSKDRCIGIQKIDTNYSLKKELILGTHDTIEWPGLRKNLDYLDTNSIFIGGSHNFCQFLICPIVCWFSLTNIDSSLQIKWQKFYGDSANYSLYGVLATKDGGILLYGTHYDTVTQSDERDIYVIKVNKDGLVGIDNKINPIAHDAIVYPNPGSEYLMVESGPQISGSEFMMLNLNGNVVTSRILNKSHEDFPTQFLPLGVYVWEIIFKGKMIESGKWIKQ